MPAPLDFANFAPIMPEERESLLRSSPALAEKVAHTAEIALHDFAAIECKLRSPQYPAIESLRICVLH
jgi:hypothetical protein